MTEPVPSRVDPSNVPTDPPATIAPAADRPIVSPTVAAYASPSLPSARAPRTSRPARPAKRGGAGAGDGSADNGGESDGGFTTVVFFLFCVAVPAASVLFELAGRLCSDALFDPLPTGWHVLFALAVPVANAWVFVLTGRPNTPAGPTRAARPPVALGHLNAVALGSAAYFTVLFAPLTPIALPGIALMGLGLLPLGPLFGLVGAIGCRARLRRRAVAAALAAADNSTGTATGSGAGGLPQSARPSARLARPRVLPRLWAGLALALVPLVGSEVWAFVTDRGLTLATDTADPARQADGVRLLRDWGDRPRMRDAAAPAGREARTRRRVSVPDGWELLRHWTVGDVDPAAAAVAYWRATGVAPADAMTGESSSAAPAAAADEDTLWSRLAWRRDPGRRADRDAPDPEGDLRGGDQVGPPVRGLSLDVSRVDVTVHADAGTFYAEWTMVLANATPQQQEARCRLLLPDGGVVSRATLWVDGSPREAAFGGRDQVRKAYQEVAVAQRRDPLLVTPAGPNRVMVQCFPVPANGTMKIRLGITAPLQLSTVRDATPAAANAADASTRAVVAYEAPPNGRGLPDRASVALPCLAERNFAVRGVSEKAASASASSAAASSPAVRPAHDVRIESGRPVAVTPADGGGLHLSAVPAGGFELVGSVAEPTLAARPTLTVPLRPDRPSAVAAPDPFDPRTVVTQTIAAAAARPPSTQPAAAAHSPTRRRLFVVVDGSAAMAGAWDDVAAALDAVPADVAVHGFLAADEGVVSSSATSTSGGDPNGGSGGGGRAFAALLRSRRPIGGQDAVPALLAAATAARAASLEDCQSSSGCGQTGWHGHVLMSVPATSFEPASASAPTTGPASRREPSSEDHGHEYRSVPPATSPSTHDGAPDAPAATDPAGPQDVLLWVRSAQPILSAHPSAVIAVLPPGLRVRELAVGPAASRVADALAEAGVVDPVPWAGSVRASLSAFVDQLAGRRTAWRFVRTHAPIRPRDPAPAAADVAPGNVNVVRLWAADEVARRLAAGDRDGAKAVAVGHQLVTAVSGAVVLETAAQYADHDLHPVSVAPVPPAAWLALATLPLFWLAHRRAKAQRAA